MTLSPERLAEIAAFRYELSEAKQMADQNLALMKECDFLYEVVGCVDPNCRDIECGIAAIKETRDERDLLRKGAK